MSNQEQIESSYTVPELIKKIDQEKEKEE